MIDWYVIEYLYPKSFKRFAQTMFPNTGIISLSVLYVYDQKKLYQFFDNEGIYLTIDKYGPKQWFYTISFKNGVVIVPEQESKCDRESIEIEGFIECFKQLENKL